VKALRGTRHQMRSVAVRIVGVRGAFVGGRKNIILRRGLALERPVIDNDHMVFPRERPGLDYALNWSLNGDGVTPFGDAFRFTKASMAEKMIGDVTKIPTVKKSGGVDPTEISSDEEWESTFDEIVNILEAAPILYVSEGDAPKTRTPCRVITDDLPLAASAMFHVLERMPLREPIELPVTVYLSKSGPDLHCIDFPQDDQAKIIITGKYANPENILSAVSLAAQTLNEPPPQPEN